MKNANTALPSYTTFHSVCSAGLSAVRPLAPSARSRDEWGWNYGTAWAPSYEAFGRMRALFALSEASSLKPKRVLEVAAGDGALCACLASQGAEVFANDLREENIRASVRHFVNSDAINILPGNLFELDPAAVGLFDLVIACEIVEHVAHTPAFLRRLKDFLTSDGHILLTTPNGRYFRNNLPTYSQIEDFSALESEQFKPDADGHLFLITPSEMGDLAQVCGLRVERLSLWGTPILTGDNRFRIFSSKKWARSYYFIENSAQLLPKALRERICTSMSVVLSLQS